MSIKIKYFFYLTVVLSISSCGSHELITGHIKDFLTNEPISGVHIYEEGNSVNETQTDSLGNFTLKAETVVIEKYGYQSKIVTFDHCESEHILLKKGK